jgi:hypothetical protein
LLLLPALAPAEIEIATECRVANRPPGCCGWCAVETLARHHHIKALYGLVDRYPMQSRPRDLEGVIAACAVDYRIQNRGDRSTEILREAIRQGLGAVVGFRPPTPGACGHIVTLVDFGHTGVRFLDPDDTQGRVRTMDLDTFLDRWDGFALVLHPPKPTHPSTK